MAEVAQNRMATTPEERDVLHRILQSVALGGDMGATVITELRAAIEAERAACAVIARGNQGSFDAYGIGESIAVAIEARALPPVAPVTVGIMTVDMGANETEGRVAKIEAPPGCSFVKSDGTPYAVGDAVKVGDPVSYSGPLDVIKAGGSIVMNGRRA